MKEIIYGPFYVKPKPIVVNFLLFEVGEHLVGLGDLLELGQRTRIILKKDKQIRTAASIFFWDHGNNKSSRLNSYTVPV